MTSITQLLSPWPVSKHSIVLREQHYPPPQSSLLDGIDSMSQQHPSPPTDPASNDAVTASAESDQGEGGADGRKGYGKRELSTSKRAAQNRAAQVCIPWHTISLLAPDSTNVCLSARVSTTKGGLHQEARGTSSRLSSPEREFQGCPGRKLPTARLHHQPAIPITRVSRGSTTAS